MRCRAHVSGAPRTAGIWKGRRKLLRDRKSESKDRTELGRSEEERGGQWAGEGGQEDTGTPTRPVGSGQESGFHPEGTGELWKSSEGGVTTLLPATHLPLA